MTRSSRFPLVFMILISLTPILSVHFPRFLAFWPLIIGLGSCLWLTFVAKEKLIFSKTYFICVGIISALCLISTLWSISPENAFEDAIKASAILWLGGLLVCACKTINTESLKPHLWLFPAAVTIAALICSFDLATDMPIYRILHGKIDTDTFNSSVMNRGIIFIILSFFLSPLFTVALDKKRKIIILTLLSISTAIVLTLTQSQTAQLCFILGIVLLMVFPSKYQISYHILLGLISIALILTPWIAHTLFGALAVNTDITQSNSLIQNAYIGNRLEIWDFVTAYAMNNPLYGYGIEATKYVPVFDHGYMYQTEASILHPHNFSVQIWIEFGLIGIFMTVIMLKLVINKISAIQEFHQKKVITVFLILLLLVSSMTYGLWQGWWLGTYVFMIALSTLFIEKQQPTTHKNENN